MILVKIPELADRVVHTRVAVAVTDRDLADIFKPNFFFDISINQKC